MPGHAQLRETRDACDVKGYTTTDPLHPRVQRVLGEAYLIEREMEDAGMSRVYLAKDTAQRAVVAKVLDLALAGPCEIARFQKEIALVADLRHPRIVRILHTVDGADDLAIYIMDFEGESVAQRMRREGKISVCAATRIISEVAEGLGVIHERGIVHRDIKPGNILCADAGAVITDFGIARYYAPGDPQITQAGRVVGTEHYMSPEQRAGLALDGRSDMFALGVVAFQMLAAHYPRPGGDAASDLRRVRGDVPVELSVAIERCLCFEPADRIDSGELRERLDHVLDNLRQAK